jgi:hypothetical protein
MAVGEGQFQLYSYIDPPLEAGTYRFRADQLLEATGPTGPRGPADLPVQQLDTFVRIRSPRYQLPPNEVLSTFPPANSEGSYGSRLAQIVIRRRTLPWERDLAGQPSTTPWLALVLVAEGEGAELRLNQPIADCVTPGTTLAGVADAELGNYLSVRKSLVDKVFPTRKDVPLLVHAREVDIHDTELMMGDDDGFLAVVVSNRLPVPGRDADGNEVAVKYLACLINLEGQFDLLRPEAPPPRKFTLLDRFERVLVDAASWDHVASGRGAEAIRPAVGVMRDEAPAAVRTYTGLPPPGAQARPASAEWSLDDAMKVESNVYADMARGFTGFAGGVTQLLDPEYRFPVLLHWSFTSVGDVTFQLLMQNVDSALLGGLADPERPKLPDAPPPSVGGRPPIEVVETGHVGLPHRTRRGDQVRTWFRGPFVAHPTQDPPEGRLALAHASDQLRIVVPDGREDLSLAAAFEIGRLLALSRPAIVASLLRWRQVGYQAARRRTIWGGFGPLLGELFGGAEGLRLDASLPVRFGRELVKRAAARPGELLGPPRSLFDPGRPLDVGGDALRLMAKGFGIRASVLEGGPVALLERLRKTDVPVAGALRERLASRVVSATLRRGLDLSLTDLVSGTLAPHFEPHPVAGQTLPLTERRARPRTDRLDALLAEGKLGPVEDKESS